MTDEDGTWDRPTEHDEPDSEELAGDDPPTTRATDGQRARARGQAIAHQLAGASKSVPSTTLPPPAPARVPAKPAPLDALSAVSAQPITAPGLPFPPRPAAPSRPASSTSPPEVTVPERPANIAQASVPPGPPPGLPLPASPRVASSVPPPSMQQARPAPPKPPTRQPTSDDGVVLLDRVSGNTPVDNAPRRSESAAGGIVVVATGPDAERVRKLCHKQGLLVPVMGSLAVVHDAMSVVVIGEPSPPAPERVVHVVRPAISDAQMIDLLRALASGRAIVEPPQPASSVDPKIAEAAKRLAKLSDRGAIEMITIEAITALTGADRAHCLFHDPGTGQLWSEAKKRSARDDRQAVAGLVGFAAQTGTTVHASPAGDDPRWLQEIDDPDGKPQSRLLVQPIIGGDRRVHAVLVAVRRWRHADFADKERTLLAQLAAVVGPALDLAVAASPIEPRRPRSTLPGAGGSTASRQSAVVGSARVPSDSRPPPVTARHSPSQQVPSVDPDPAAATSRLERSSLDDSGPVQRPDLPKLDERHSAESIPALPRPPRPGFTAPPINVEAKATSEPSAIAKPIDKPIEKPIEKPAEKPPVEKSGPTHKRAGTAPVRTKSPSDAPKSRDYEPRDLAVIANAEDAKRAQRLAKKSRLEISTFATIADAPEHLPLVTIGETWSQKESRVVYAARTSITDDQLTDLLVGLTSGRSAAPTPVLTRPATAAEARRTQVAFSGARKLASATERHVVEDIAIATIKDLLDTDRAYCLFVDPDSGALWSEARRRATMDDRQAIAGIAGWVARTGRAANVPRASADPRWLGPIDDPDGDPNSQLLVQPLVRADQCVNGVLVAVRRARRPGFTELDAALFARFAALAGPIVEQLAVYLDTIQLVGDDTNMRAPIPTAPDSALVAILKGQHPAARWVYLLIGAIVAFILGATLV